MSRAVFAWEGFRLEHPDDWSPVALSGNRRSGYARLQGPGRKGCQLRWNANARQDFGTALDAYFRLLERDSRKASVRFETSREQEGGRLLYRWTGDGQGRGAILLVPDGRLVFLEASGGKSDALRPTFQSLLQSFGQAESDGLEEWALFGMRVRLPKDLSPSERTLQSGRTSLTFRARGAVLEAGRWALGRQLADRYGLAGWSFAALGMPKAAEVKELDGERVELAAPESRLRAGVRALVRLSPATNQIVMVKCASRGAQWMPEWSWLE
jgi:hypothetical protein